MFPLSSRDGTLFERPVESQTRSVLFHEPLEVERLSSDCIEGRAGYAGVVDLGTHMLTDNVTICSGVRWNSYPVLSIGDFEAHTYSRLVRSSDVN